MRIALFQGPEHTGPVADNLAAIARAARAAADAGARLLVCPEMSDTGYHIGGRARDLAEPADGRYAAAVGRLCREAGIAVVHGYPERGPGGVYNATQLVDRDGAPLADYRKCHLFGDIDRAVFAAGDRLVVQCALDGLTVGLLTCYDVEFPEAVRAHALAGTELLVVPTGLMEPFSLVSEVLVPARAYESQVFVAYANRCGSEGELTYCGSSCVAAPDGCVPARAGRAEQLLVVDVDREVLRASRAVNTHLQDRRPDLYGQGPG